MTVPPRLFGIVATRAPVVAVLRRGPSDWSHVGRWDVAGGVYEPGAWIRGTLYPQGCDLSPDGRWLSYFALKAGPTWAVGATYVAISRLPWLTALAAWPTGGTWTRAETFAVERRREWTETADTPPRSPDDAWHEQRSLRVTMERRRPGSEGDVRLTVRGHYAAFRSSLPGEEKDIEYTIVEGRRTRPLDNAQWADWGPDGQLLVATREGRLQIRDGDGRRVAFEVDLAALAPTPLPPPAEASVW